MEKILKEKLHLGFVKCSSRCCGTNESEVIETDEGKMFVKFGTEELVKGEFESLRAIRGTGTIACPRPICALQVGEDKWALVTSHIQMKRSRESSEKFPKQLAEMHLHNSKLLENETKQSVFVGRNIDSDSESFQTKKFGFPISTCCGYLPQENEWADDWETFFIRHRLNPQISRLIENHHDHYLMSNSEILYRKASSLLECRNGITPSLVHGDLWGGNWSGFVNDDGEANPIVFDPSASYSDPEFEQGIMQVFGGVTHDFLSSYYQTMKDQQGREDRVKLYELYHLLNHWNHFGGSYKNSSLRLIHEIIG